MYIPNDVGIKLLVLSQRIRKYCFKTLDTNVIYSPMSSSFLTYDGGGGQNP